MYLCGKAIQYTRSEDKAFKESWERHLAGPVAMWLKCDAHHF